MSYILPWGPLHLLKAERTAGFVDIPDFFQEDESSRGWDNTRNASQAPSGSPSWSQITTNHPPTLERKQTMSGDIVVMTFNTNDNNHDIARDATMTPCAFWLQRKLRKTHDGLIRLGYQLKQQKQHPHPVSTASVGKWELDTDVLGQPKFVTIHILPSSVLDDQPTQSQDRAVVVATANAYSHLNELSALQRIANHHHQHHLHTTTSKQRKHVVGTRLVATSSQYVYAVLPYYRDGTLLQFCQMVGPLMEPLARFFFKQIVKVRKEIT
jgi:hypothetical protein